jgi:hypothetical protein
MCSIFSLSSRHLLSLFFFLPIPVLSLLVPTSATRYHFPLSHTLSPLPIVRRFSYSLSSLLLICAFISLPFYSPSPCTFSRRVVFLFSPSSSNFSSVSPVSHPIYTSPRLSVFCCILFSPFFLYLSPLWPTLLTSFEFPFLLLSNRHLYRVFSKLRRSF